MFKKNPFRDPEFKSAYGVSMFALLVLVGATYLISIPIEKRSKIKHDDLVSKVIMRADTSKNGELESEEIERIYEDINKPFYEVLTDKDMKAYLEK